MWKWPENALPYLSKMHTNPDIRKRSILITEDGSTTLKLCDFDEQFHSLHGAVNESMHVYINAGLQYFIEKENINILEMGFGTGLNAILTIQRRNNRTIAYHGIEAFPLNDEEINNLNFQDFIDPELYEVFQQLHQCNENEWIEPYNNFKFKKSIIKLEDILLENDFYDLVYYDAFSPDIQPELWDEIALKKIYRSMKKKSVLVTYCAKGSVKRVMKVVGFEVEGLPGPVGKREISRCIKK